MQMTHRQKVLSLYRRALKTSLDWTVHRSAYRGQAIYIRSLFEANKNESNTRNQKTLVNETERILRDYRHPEPIRIPTAPGGSKYERNLPPPILDAPPKMHI